MRTRGHKGRDGGVGPQTQDGFVVALSSNNVTRTSNARSNSRRWPKRQASKSADKTCSHNDHSMNTLPTGANIREQHIIQESQNDTGCIWLFEQEPAFGFSIVSINARMTIKLNHGGCGFIAIYVLPSNELLGHEDTRSDYIKEFFYKA
ncbi:hypothetical protein Tco_0734286 [Tanacetum coccineum]